MKYKGDNMTWDFYGEGNNFILKERKQVPKEILDSLDAKGKKRLKKTLQAAEPTEFFGQDFTKLGDLISTLKELDLMKSDKKLNKKIKSMDERNIDIVATATKLRKEYELLFRQLRDIVYPTGKKERKE
jgi:hypothetical protein|tara:strand:+ start:84 stop:470 length:387 start_codon:yes stop_codon:yes gene_type:complete